MSDVTRRPRQHDGRSARAARYGMEPVTRPPRSDVPQPRLQRPVQPVPSQATGHAVDPQSPENDTEFLDQKEALLERLHSFHAPYEGLEFLFSPFESDATRSVKATFRDGHRIAEVRDDSAVIKPIVGITFLPGADTPQVQYPTPSQIPS